MPFKYYFNRSNLLNQFMYVIHLVISSANVLINLFFTELNISLNTTINATMYSDLWLGLGPTDPQQPPINQTIGFHETHMIQLTLCGLSGCM